MTELDKLIRRQREEWAIEGGYLGRITWAPGAENLTVEERAKAVNDMLDAVDRGDYEPMDFGDLRWREIDPEPKPFLPLMDVIKNPKVPNSNPVWEKGEKDQ